MHQSSQLFLEGVAGHLMVEMRPAVATSWFEEIGFLQWSQREQQGYQQVAEVVEVVEQG